MAAFLGKHLMVDFTGCSAELLNDVVFLENVMVEAAREANATVVNSTFHHFSPIGVSGVVVIEESHLAIHTWPEYGLASIDVFTCGDKMDPMVAANRLKQALLAQQMLKHEYPRAHTGKMVPPQKQAEHSPTVVQRAVWFTERVNDMAFSVRHQGGLLFRQQTDFQRIEVFETEGFGRMLVLDGAISLTEHDEWMYHEMLVHIPVLSAPTPKKVLVLGGGDGGVITQLLKHPDIKEITVVEKDPMIREVSKRFFPQISKGFGNEKVHWIFQDAGETIWELPEQQFDLILVDIADSLHPDAPISNQTFLERLKALLSPAGNLVMPISVPRTNQHNKVANQLRALFSYQQVDFFWAHIPTFPLGICLFAWCQVSEKNPLKPDLERQKQFLQEGKPLYYTSAIHLAAFALPKFMQDLLDEK